MKVNENSTAWNLCQMQELGVVWKFIKVHWETEELNIYYRKNGYPKKVWKDNEGMPFGIYLLEANVNNIKDLENIFDEEVGEVLWFSTEEERDKVFNEEKELIEKDNAKLKT